MHDLDPYLSNLNVRGVRKAVKRDRERRASGITREAEMNGHSPTIVSQLLSEPSHWPIAFQKVSAQVPDETPEDDQVYYLVGA